MSGTEAATLRGFVHELPRTERLVLILYYAEKLTAREISLVLDLSEDRVAQVLANLQSRARVILLGIARRHRRAKAAAAARN